MSINSLNSFNSRQTLDVAGTSYEYFSLEAFAAQRGDVKRLPLTLKVLLENLLRNEDGVSVTKRISAPWSTGWISAVPTMKLPFARHGS